MKGSYNLNTLPARPGVDSKKMSIPDTFNASLEISNNHRDFKNPTQMSSYITSSENF